MRFLLDIFSIAAYVVIIVSFPTSDFFNEFQIEPALVEESSFWDDSPDFTVSDVVAGVNEECRSDYLSPDQANNNLRVRGGICKIRSPTRSSGTGQPDDNSQGSGESPVYDPSKPRTQSDEPKNKKKCPADAPLGVCRKYAGNRSPNLWISSLPWGYNGKCEIAFRS